MLKIRFLSILVLLSVVAVTSGSITQAQNVTALAGHSVSDVNVRATPSLSGSTIAVLPAGEKVTAVGRNNANNWIQIQYGNTTGWVAAWVTVYSGNTSLLPITNDSVSEPVGGPGPFVLTSPFNVNIRAAPRVGAANLGRLPFNASASATGRNEANSWVFIEYKGITGWVAAWLTLLSNDINALPIAAGGSGPSPTTLPSPTLAPNTTPITPLEPLPSGGITVQSLSRTNVRSIPSLNGVVIDVLPFSGTASVIGRNAGGNWLQINHSGTVGWVARWVVVTSDDTSNVIITSDVTEIGPTTGVITGRGIYDVFIRSGPSLNNGQVGVLPPAGKAELLARTAASNWIKVRYQETEGWVAGWVIVATADMLNLPVEE
jgi:N-acetylmuramoyl-L-alanine amidase